MYFVEQIIKFYLKYKNRKNNTMFSPDAEEEILEDIVTCRHNFMPIDSTGNILACSKCGYVVKKKRLKKNPSKDSF